ncbi:MAG: MarR family transcriptional regulator [Alphaproteobacteria bacterium]
MNQITRHDTFGRTLANLGRLLRVELNRQMHAHGLSFPQWLVLRTLAEKGDGVVQKELAEALGIEGATLVGLLDRLARGGWIERREAAHDRRYKTVHLNPAARARLAPLYDVQEAVWEHLLDGVPADDVAACQAVLEGMLARAQRITDMPPVSFARRDAS